MRSKNTRFSDRTFKMNTKRKNYSNIAEIDSSLLIRRIASASMVERVSTRTLPSACISGESGTVSVTTISSIASLAKCCAAAPRIRRELRKQIHVLHHVLLMLQRLYIMYHLYQSYHRQGYNHDLRHPR